MGISGFVVCVGGGAVAVTVTTCRRNKEARDRGSSLVDGTVLVGKKGKSMGRERGASFCKEGRSDRRARGCRIRSAEDVSRGGIASNYRERASCMAGFAHCAAERVCLRDCSLRVTAALSLTCRPRSSAR